MQYLVIIKTILSLIPALIDALKSIEAAVPEGGKGAEKLAWLKSVLQATYSAATDAEVKFETLWPVLSQVISVTVGLFNSVGTFAKK